MEDPFVILYGYCFFILNISNMYTTLPNALAKLLVFDVESRNLDSHQHRSEQQESNLLHKSSADRTLQILFHANEIITCGLSVLGFLFHRYLGRLLFHRVHIR